MQVVPIHRAIRVEACMQVPGGLHASGAEHAVGGYLVWVAHEDVAAVPADAATAGLAVVRCRGRHGRLAFSSLILSFA